jgi:hypothetical protein
LCRRAVLLFVPFLSACSGARDQRRGVEPADLAVCNTVDSVLSRSGWWEPLETVGKVKIDVKKYRVRGRYRMTSEGNGNVTVEFAGSMVLGGHHEDVVVSLHGGVLRILDRERGRLYEKTEADEMVRDGLDVDWNLSELIRRVIARPVNCSSLSAVSVTGDTNAGGVTLEGRLDGERFRLEFENGRLEKASWPVPSRRGLDDRMTVRYDWGARGSRELRELVVFLEGRRWRIKMDTE